MKTEMQRLATNQGQKLIQLMASDNGVPELGAKCEGCTYDLAIVREYGGAEYCGICMIKDLKECQNRWQTITDFAYQGLGEAGYSWFKNSQPHPRLHRVMYSGVFGGIIAELSTMPKAVN